MLVSNLFKATVDVIIDEFYLFVTLSNFIDWSSWISVGKWAVDPNFSSGFVITIFSSYFRASASCVLVIVLSSSSTLRLSFASELWEYCKSSSGSTSLFYVLTFFINGSVLIRGEFPLFWFLGDSPKIILRGEKDRVLFFPESCNV